MTIHPTRTAIPFSAVEITAFCEKHRLRRMWLFGSVLGDDFSPDSDVDVLVEFDPDHVPGWEFLMRGKMSCPLSLSAKSI